MKKTRSGFSSVEALLIFVIVGILSGAGWYVYSSNNKAKQSLSNADVSSSISIQNVKKVNNTSGLKYLDVKEWGVKFKLDASNNDATYEIEKPDSSWVYVTTPKLIDISNKVSQCSGAYKSVSLNRAKVGDDRFGSPWTEAELQEIGTKLDNYYYFQGADQPCSGSSDEDMKKIPAGIKEEVGQIRTSLSKLSKSVTKD